MARRRQRNVENPQAPIAPPFLNFDSASSGLGFARRARRLQRFARRTGIAPSRNKDEEHYFKYIFSNIN
jgi:hypothetical protein